MEFSCLKQQGRRGQTVPLPGDSLRAKTDLAMKNETLAKFVCHNICCVISGIYERGIDPRFLGLPAVTETACT